MVIRKDLNDSCSSPFSQDEWANVRDYAPWIVLCPDQDKERCRLLHKAFFSCLMRLLQLSVKRLDCRSLISSRSSRRINPISLDLKSPAECNNLCALQNIAGVGAFASQNCFCTVDVVALNFSVTRWTLSVGR